MGILLGCLSMMALEACCYALLLLMSPLLVLIWAWQKLLSSSSRTV